MTENEIIADINNEITFSGALPYSLPEKELKRILDNDARFFWDNWHYAVETRYLRIPVELFANPSFKKHRQIHLPECVGFVTQFIEITGGSIFGTMDLDFAEQKFVGSEIYLTPFMGESIMYRTVMLSFMDLTKSMMLDTVAYKFNPNTNLLFVEGRTPRVVSVLKILKKIEKNALYEDNMYQRYVRAHAKVRLAHMLQSFNFTLPGDGTLNYQNMVTTAEKEMEDVKAAIRSETTPSWMYLGH